ncbi:MAG: UDP-N-acetylmuramoyl-L-alanyl-D-glutamate--2,6-diaminopimelate ligase [Gemmatimonadota bacterium]|nr:MAG: UDP-N-acetylmuramoyl-L-alanyl-D-glutamate--2,6-diaminopimelate ligase [Gemmatimonadota bacterium]
MNRETVTLASVTEVLRAAGLIQEIHGPEDVALHGVTQDSRDVEPGDLFLAWKGDRWDAHDFVGAAAETGAVAAVVERPVAEARIPQLQVSNGRRSAALAADVVMGSPWKSLFTVGVTGTNGKTTTALLARHILAAHGRAAAMGTLGLVDADGRVRPGSEGLTTPGPVRIAEWLRALADDGVEAVAMEASSHALAQHRLDGVRFDAAIFTNLSRDHLDYHESFEDYLSAKAHLIDLVKDDGVAIVNGDDPAWADLPVSGTHTISYAVESDAEIRGVALEPGPEGTRFRMAADGDEYPVDLPLLGRFNVENALAAAGAAAAVGLALDVVAERLTQAPQLPGRMEIVTRDPFTVLIDFAHTPDALRRVLETLRPDVGGRLIVVFGAGGDRDATKRPLMGEAVAGFADFAIVTSDNPRDEDPDAIIDDVVAGMTGRNYERLPDRRAAICRALDMAEAGDTVVLAGKGHETYQAVGTGRLPFDERAIVLECLKGGER